ncbi:hypothetical protein GF359_10190 [candidate division WOR-3 bacterium]|uniref:Uncharacterized protein n=1 Tax=candidate division WOR-3 bacterium TaxID=2052148 RepID=A0A9D5KCB9_UNCW3|nr:hypothetical protein [candidate division WOR-3 bacterium]MBD3365569.1 hypothetical protein [candidate division WOR-3 bacterium]
MRKLVLLLAAALVFAGFMGLNCGEDVTESIEQIEQLLLTSYFTGEGTDGVTDDSTAEIQSSMAILVPKPDTGHQHWARVINHFNRDVDVTVEGDSAFAVITNHFEGNIYIHDLSITDSFVKYERPIDDSTYREVVLSKGGGKLHGGWKIEEITPVKIWTNNPETAVGIASVKVTSTSGEDFEITSTDDWYGRDDIPRFTPDDTVTVEVTLADDVETWAYLHHGRHFRLKFKHHRKVFDRDTTDIKEFTGTWVTADDYLLGKDITVRHAAVDVILAETLDGDSTAEYSSFAIAFPYLIAKEGLELPEDGDPTNK